MGAQMEVYNWLMRVLTSDINFSAKTLATQIYPALLDCPPPAESLQVSESAIHRLTDRVLEHR